jgi:hypothetical protein
MNTTESSVNGVSGSNIKYILRQAQQKLPKLHNKMRLTYSALRGIIRSSTAYFRRNHSTRPATVRFGFLLLLSPLNIW